MFRLVVELEKMRKKSAASTIAVLCVLAGGDDPVEDEERVPDVLLGQVLQYRSHRILQARKKEKSTEQGFPTFSDSCTTH